MMPNNDLMPWFDQLKRINLEHLAEKLQLERNGSNGNYRSPNRADKHHSLSIYSGGKYGWGWKDHATNEGGSSLDLMIYCGQANDVMGAAKVLADWYDIPQPRAQNATPVARLSREEYIAKRCLDEATLAFNYLQERGIAQAVIQEAINRKTIGFNTYTSPKLDAGQCGYGGHAVAFIVYNGNARAVAVDLRFLDPKLNGDVKTQCQGEKNGYGWTSCPNRLKKAKTVFIVESPINALSIETAFNTKSVAAFAIRGVANATNIDWSFLRGKKAIIALDHTDVYNPKTGKRPGMEAAYALSDALTGADISSRMVDMLDWDEGEDINDVLVAEDAYGLQQRLKKLDPWLIAGMPSVGVNELDKMQGRRRIFLPPQDMSVYWRYRVMDDFTQYVDEYKDNTQEDGGNQRSETMGDLCSFRVCSLSRLSIQSHLATINGTPDNQPETVFGVSCQTPRNGNLLQREVIQGDKIYNLDWWKGRFGHIWKPAQFARMVTILERSADLAAKEVVNFVGLAWRDGVLSALEGQDCFFVEPQKQCLYYNMSFPRGTQQHARKVIQAYQETFHENAASIAMVWALGAHIKTVLGYYPHFQMQAEKGAGKSKLLESLQSSLAFQILSGQMLKTDHRRRASVSYTTHPVGWDEFSKLPKNVLSDIDGLLQSTYRFEFTRIGNAMIPYLMCSPVLLAGEEVDVESLQSKICRSTLAVKKQGEIIPHGLPQFPTWQWLQFLADTQPERIRETHKNYYDYCKNRSRSGENDATAKRMIENYAAILTAWALLCEFADIDITQGDFIEDLLSEMNNHIADTDGTRLPWVWIMEILLSELEANRYEHPFCWGNMDTPKGRCKK